MAQSDHLQSGMPLFPLASHFNFQYWFV
jgi:hypothetical protein